MLAGIIPNPYRTEGCYAEQKTEYTNEILCYGRRKTADEEKMKLLPTQRYGAYLRKMAIDAYIIYTDTANIKTFTSELQGIGRNINQIAKRLNAGAPIYEADIAEIKERLNQIWQLQRHILSSLR